jgi:hypothetical protein
MEKKESAFLSVNQRPDLISDNAYYILGRVYTEAFNNGVVKSEVTSAFVVSAVIEGLL